MLEGLIGEVDELVGVEISDLPDAAIRAEYVTLRREIDRQEHRAAALLVAIAVPAWRSATAPPPIVDPAGPVKVSARPAVEVATEFFPLMYSNVPVTNGHTVRLELPQAALTSFGLEADDASGTVLADVLVGQDGLARAVSFVRPAVTKKEQR